MKTNHPTLLISLVLFFSLFFGEIVKCQHSIDSTAFHYFDKADSLRRLQAYDSAQCYYIKSGELFLRQGLKEKYLEALVKTAYIYSYKNLIDSTNNLVELIIEKAPELAGDSSKILIDCYTLKSRIASRYSDFWQATYYMTRTVQLSEEYYGIDHITTSSAYGNLGIVHDIAGNFKEAITYYRKASQIVRKNYGEDHPMVAAGYNNIGNIYGNLGKLDSSLIMHEKALAIRLKVLGENDLNTAASYSNLSVIYYERGDYQKALNYERSVFAIRKAVLGEEHPLTAMCYNNFGAVYEAIGNYDKALENHLKALAIREKLLPDNHPDIAMSYMNLANVYRHFDQFDKALEYHTKSYIMKKDLYGDYHPDIAQVLSNMGDIYFRMGDYRMANLKFEEATHNMRKCFVNYTHPDIAIYANNKAEGLNELNELDSALYYVDYAMQVNRRIIENADGVSDTIILDYQMYLKLLHLKARIYFHKYNMDISGLDVLKKSVFAYKRAIGLTEEMRRSYSMEESKEYLAENSEELFCDATNTCYIYYKASSDSTALETMHNLMERSRHGILRDVLMKNNLTEISGIPDSLRMKEKELSSIIRSCKAELVELEERSSKAELIALEGENDTAIDNRAMKELYNDLFHYEQEYDDLQFMIAANYPKLNQMDLVSELLSWKKICESRDTNEVLISYNISDTSLYISLFDDQNYNLFRQTIDTSFEKSIHRYLKSIKTYDFDTYRQMNSALYSKLIAPIEDRINPKKHVIIVPDKALYYLPFETLFSEPDDKEDLVFSELDYLVKQHDIRYRYTASMFLNDPGNGTVHGSLSEGFIGFAPVFDSDSSNSSVMMEGTPVFDTLMNNEMALRSVSIDGITFNELNFSENEVQEIRSLFQNKNLPASAYFHSMANEERFRQESGKYKFIHIATHGMINENYPDLSGLIFSQPEIMPETKPEEKTDGKISYEDGILYASEIYGLDLNADLVVLSACETGTGKMIKGEGIISMTRGFFCSGTPNVMLSLWKVGDKSTRELMVLFYSQLLNGKSYSGALQSAKIEMIKNKEYAYPLYWGGFALIGTN